MIKFVRLPAGLLLGFAVSLSTLAIGAETPPSEASVKHLLEVTQVRKLLDSTMAQMDGILKNAMQQVTQGQTISPEIQKQIDKARSDSLAMMKEALDWNKLEPMYVRIYQKSFNQQEIDGLIAMYQTPAGQALLNKMPVVIQNTVVEMQQLMQPIMQKVRQTQQSIATEIQAEKAKKNG